MRARFRDISGLNRAIATSVFLLFSMLVGPADVRADWGGTISGNATTSEGGDTRTRSLDQQYTLFTSGSPTPTIRYSLSGLFRHLRSQTGDGPYLWSNEVSPTGVINWNMGVLDTRANASYRADRDELGTNRLTNRMASVYTQTTWQTLPRLYGSLSWAKNVNDLDLLGYDTRSRTMAAGGTYNHRRLYLNYEYSDYLTHNELDDIDRSSKSHNGRADFGTSLLKRIVSFQTGYQITSRKESERSSATGETLVPLPTMAGLYLADNSPEFDALESAPSLVDGITEIPAGDYNLVNGTAHNFGLDFGAPVTVDHLFLYVDTLDVGTLTWSIWQSSDNLTWTPVARDVRGTFRSPFWRYEFSFAPVETRYIKLSLTPQLQITPIEVTELRGFVTRTQLGDLGRTTDHRGSARIQVQPAKWFGWEVGGDVLRQSETQFALAREEDVFQASTRFNRLRLLDTAVRYTWSRSNYLDAGDRDVQTSLISAIVRSKWNRALSTAGLVERSDEQLDEVLSRRNNRLRADINALLFPALRVTSQFAYAEDERFATDDVIFTRSVTTAFEGEPTTRSQITVTHRYETQNAHVSAVRKYRTSVGGRLNYRLTDKISITTSATTSEDPTRTDRTYDAIVGWNPSHKLSIGGTFNRIEGSLAEDANQYSLQTVYYWTSRTEITASYSVNERADFATTYSSRISLLSRF